VVDALHHFREHLLAFLDCEERLLRGVYENADYDLVEQFAAALDDVQVTVCYGIKRTGIDSASHQPHTTGILQIL
jgi:hypothetical protein